MFFRVTAPHAASPLSLSHTCARTAPASGAFAGSHGTDPDGQIHIFSRVTAPHADSPLLSRSHVPYLSMPFC